MRVFWLFFIIGAVQAVAEIYRIHDELILSLLTFALFAGILKKEKSDDKQV